MASALTSHFASPGKAIRSFPEALDLFSCLKAPHKSGFDAGRMGGFSRSPRLVTLAEAIDIVRGRSTS